MGNAREYIRSTPEFQTTVDQGQQQAEAAATTAAPRADGLGPVTSMEKGDLMFWMAVAQTALLFLIWRELMRGPA